MHPKVIKAKIARILSIDLSNWLQM